MSFERKISNCQYSTYFELWLDSLHIASEAIVNVDGDHIFMQLENPKSKSFKLFDLNHQAGQKYAVQVYIDSIGPKSLNVLLKNVFKEKNGSKTYQYLLKNGFRYYSGSYDIVLFLNSKKGIIGSYFQGSFYNEPYMVSPVGDILQDKIDYSEMELRVLK